MCGILAILSDAGSVSHHAERADQLLDRLEHRGPDGRGTLLSSSSWLGHRRLAIMDVAGGHQPFERDGVTWMVNGEIYNHAQLRLELSDMEGGFADLPASDSAVVGPLFQQHGAKTPTLLDGQFAFVAVEEDRGRWMAARDHAGICPLYLGRHVDGTLWFASEMKALIDDCESVEIVPPGHAWIQENDGQGPRRIKWYDPTWAHEVPSEPLDLTALREGLKAAVRKRLMTDVPCGLLLSGGLDSSLIAAIAVRERAQIPELSRFGDRFHTFSIGLEGAPDLLAARRVAEFLGTIHHEYHFTIEEALATVPAVVHHLESFEQIRTAVPTYLLAQRIRETGVKMVLSGEGADEAFGGYLYFHRAPDSAAFHQESVRKIMRLHQFDVMRANKATMAHGLEVRVPFLDAAYLDLVMSLDPSHKRADLSECSDGRHPRMEKYILRKAFDCPAAPWLPEEILWRQKEQFSDGVGYAWVDCLREFAQQRLEEATWAERFDRFGDDAPATPEMHWMRELFEERFVTDRAAGASALLTVPRGRSVACSTPEALSWDPAWENAAGDISGRSIAGVHLGSAGFSLNEPSSSLLKR